MILGQRNGEYIKVNSVKNWTEARQYHRGWGKNLTVIWFWINWLPILLCYSSRVAVRWRKESGGSDYCDTCAGHLAFSRSHKESVTTDHPLRYIKFERKLISLIAAVAFFETYCFNLLQTVKFKSYLLSLGIPDPVTRDSHKSTSVYLEQLAKQVSSALHQPLQVSIIYHIIYVISRKVYQHEQDKSNEMTAYFIAFILYMLVNLPRKATSQSTAIAGISGTVQFWSCSTFAHLAHPLTVFLS